MANRPQPHETKARLFDADKSDSEIEISPKTVASVTDRQLLWVDAVVGAEPADLDGLLAVLPFDKDVVEGLQSADSGPRLTVLGNYFLARLVLMRERAHQYEPVVLDLVAGKNVVLTTHREPVAFLSELDSRIRGDTTLGEIGSTAFATDLMDGLLTSYLELADSILVEVDRLDGQALKSGRGRDFLTNLVALRHRIADVRRVLVAHRTVIAAMAGADFQTITGTAASPRFAALTERFDGTIGAIDTAREALLGTFDIYMSRTAQRTNDAIKTLTIVSVLLLPTGVMAGFMGMNIRAPYSNDDPLVFWVVVAGITLFAAVTLFVLRRREWL